MFNLNNDVLILYFVTVALIATCVIFVYDRKTKGNLNMSPVQRIQYNNEMYVPF